MNRKISIKYTYPKKKYINNGKIKMENEDYLFYSHISCHGTYSNRDCRLCFWLDP